MELWLCDMPTKASTDYNEQIHPEGPPVIVGVVYMPGGSGKTTFYRGHGDTFFDIDDVWDPEAETEAGMIREWNAAVSNDDANTRRRLEQDCVTFKAVKYRKLVLEKKLQPKVVLCQSREQASILLGCSPTEHEAVLCLIPSEDLHERNMTGRGDDERVSELCREQRRALRMLPSCIEYHDFQEMERMLLEFSGQLKVTEPRG